MALSYQSVNMSLNLFDIPDIDYRYEAKRWIPFKPANTGARPILFTVPSGDDYYDLNDTKLEIKVRLNFQGQEVFPVEREHRRMPIIANISIGSTILVIRSLIK